MITKLYTTSILDSIINDVFYSKDYYPTNKLIYSNSADLSRDEESYTFKSIATGLKEEDLDIFIDNQDLVVKTKEVEEEEMFRSKIDHKIRLKEKVDKENVVAKLDMGVLEITIPFDKSSIEKHKIKFV